MVDGELRGSARRHHLNTILQSFQLPPVCTLKVFQRVEVNITQVQIDGAKSGDLVSQSRGWDITLILVYYFVVKGFEVVLISEGDTVTLPNRVRLGNIIPLRPTVSILQLGLKVLDAAQTFFRYQCIWLLALHLPTIPSQNLSSLRCTPRLKRGS